MKKILSLAMLALALITLAACGNSSKAATPKDTVNLKVVFSKQKTDTFNQLAISKNENVMTLLKSKEKVAETGGFITKIGNVEQNLTAKKYWMYKLNGKLAMKGAEQQTLKKGDNIEFYLG